MIKLINYQLILHSARSKAASSSKILLNNSSYQEDQTHKLLQRNFLESQRRISCRIAQAKLLQSSLGLRFSFSTQKQEKAKTPQYKSDLKGRIFLDQNKFERDEQVGGYLLYQSRDARFIFIYSLLAWTIVAYNLYVYYFSEMDEDTDNAFYMLIGFGSILLISLFRFSKQPHKIWLDFGGQTTYIEFYSIFGISSQLRKINNREFFGFTYLLHRRLGLPIFRYSFYGKKKFAFFKPSEAKDAEAMRLLLAGNEFVISDPQMHIKISKTMENKYYNKP